MACWRVKFQNCLPEQHNGLVFVMGKQSVFCDEETEILSTIYMCLSGFKVLMRSVKSIL